MLTQGLSVGGRLELPPDARLIAWLARYEGEPLFVDLRPVHERRTSPQNRRIWAGYQRALRSFSALSGHDKDELHDAMKNRFVAPVRLYTEGGDLIGEARSTRRMSRPAFSDFNEEVSALFASYGCDLYPDKEEA